MRLDAFLVEKGFFDSRTKAKQSVERGEICIDGKTVNKPSQLITNLDCRIERICQESFVSLGGFKLKKALDDFNLSVCDLVCVDIGASTGGFTDCLIQRGAKRVFAVDLNDGLLHPLLKENDSVVPIIKNVKNLEKTDFNQSIDLCVADLSFISITQALPVIAKILDDGKRLITLIKPQFESGVKKRFKNGVIRDKKIQLEACFKAYDCAKECSLAPTCFTTAPINEGKNVEFLMLFEKNGNIILDKSSIDF